MRALLTLLLVLWASVASARPCPWRIEMPWGYIECSNNELLIASTVDDPPKLRLSSITGSTGAVSWSIQRPDGSLDELVLLQGKKDERTRGRSDVNYGEMTLHLKGPARFPGDDGMILSALFLHDYAWIRGLDLREFGPFPPGLLLPEPPPVDPWLTPEARARHLRELTRIEEEMGIPMDTGRWNAYLEGRNRNLAEVHDDELLRTGLPFDPCEGRNRVPE